MAGIQKKLDDLYNSESKEYFTGNNADVFFNNIYVDECTSLGYRSVVNTSPVYSYNSELFNSITQGNFRVEGKFTVNFVSNGYIEHIIQRGESAKLNAEFTPLGKLSGRGNATQFAQNNAAFKNLNDPNFIDTAIFDPRATQLDEAEKSIARAKLRDYIWGYLRMEDTALIESLREVLVGTYFDILVMVGNPNTDSYDVMNFVDCQILDVSMEIVQGMPLQLMYTWVARDKDRPASRPNPFDFIRGDIPAARELELTPQEMLDNIVYLTQLYTKRNILDFHSKLRSYYAAESNENPTTIKDVSIPAGGMNINPDKFDQFSTIVGSGQPAASSLGFKDTGGSIIRDVVISEMHSPLSYQAFNFEVFEGVTGNNRPAETEFQEVSYGGITLPAPGKLDITNIMTTSDTNFLLENRDLVRDQIKTSINTATKSQNLFDFEEGDTTSGAEFAKEQKNFSFIPGDKAGVFIDQSKTTLSEKLYHLPRNNDLITPLSIPDTYGSIPIGSIPTEGGDLYEMNIIPAIYLPPTITNIPYIENRDDASHAIHRDMYDARKQNIHREGFAAGHESKYDPGLKRWSLDFTAGLNVEGLKSFMVEDNVYNSTDKYHMIVVDIDVYAAANQEPSLSNMRDFLKQNPGTFLRVTEMVKNLDSNNSGGTNFPTAEQDTRIMVTDSHFVICIYEPNDKGYMGISTRVEAFTGIDFTYDRLTLRIENTYNIKDYIQEEYFKYQDGTSRIGIKDNIEWPSQYVPGNSQKVFRPIDHDSSKSFSFIDFFTESPDINQRVYLAFMVLQRPTHFFIPVSMKKDGLEKTYYIMPFSDSNLLPEHVTKNDVLKYIDLTFLASNSGGEGVHLDASSIVNINIGDNVSRPWIDFIDLIGAVQSNPDGDHIAVLEYPIINVDSNYGYRVTQEIANNKNDEALLKITGDNDVVPLTDELKSHYMIKYMRTVATMVHAGGYFSPNPDQYRSHMGIYPQVHKQHRIYMNALPFDPNNIFTCLYSDIVDSLDPVRLFAIETILGDITSGPFSDILATSDSAKDYRPMAVHVNTLSVETFSYNETDDSVVSERSSCGVVYDIDGDSDRFTFLMTTHNDDGDNAKDFQALIQGMAQPVAFYNSIYKNNSFSSNKKTLKNLTVGEVQVLYVKKENIGTFKSFNECEFNSYVFDTITGDDGTTIEDIIQNPIDETQGVSPSDIIVIRDDGNDEDKFKAMYSANILSYVYSLKLNDTINPFMYDFILGKELLLDGPTENVYTISDIMKDLDITPADMTGYTGIAINIDKLDYLRRLLFTADDGNTPIDRTGKGIRLFSHQSDLSLDNGDNLLTYKVGDTITDSNLIQTKFRNGEDVDIKTGDIYKARYLPVTMMVNKLTEKNNEPRYLVIAHNLVENIRKISAGPLPFYSKLEITTDSVNDENLPSITGFTEGTVPVTLLHPTDGIDLASHMESLVNVKMHDDYRYYIYESNPAIISNFIENNFPVEWAKLNTSSTEMKLLVAQVMFDTIVEDLNRRQPFSENKIENLSLQSRAFKSLTGVDKLNRKERSNIARRYISNNNIFNNATGISKVQDQIAIGSYLKSKDQWETYITGITPDARTTSGFTIAEGDIPKAILMVKQPPVEIFNDIFDLAAKHKTVSFASTEDDLTDDNLFNINTDKYMYFGLKAQPFKRNKQNNSILSYDKNKRKFFNTNTLTTFRDIIAKRDYYTAYNFELHVIHDSFITPEDEFGPIANFEEDLLSLFLTSNLPVVHQQDMTDRTSVKDPFYEDDASLDDKIEGAVTILAIRITKS